VPSRIVHLPLSWRDPATIETIEKYMAAVRDDAPWCPDNIEFIRRVNGLPDADAVEQVIFDASYLVLGWATSISARRWRRRSIPGTGWSRPSTTRAHLDPPNVVGIGGAYMCIYGMEGPGGYQLFGRTIQVWNTHRETDAFEAGKPWLLRFFDQIRFFKVSAEELADWRRISPAGAGPSRSRNRSSASPTTARSCATTPIRSPFEATAGGLRCGTRRMAAHRRIRPGDRPDRSGQWSAAVAIEVPDGADVIEAPFGGVCGSCWSPPATRWKPVTRSR
jgi:urea carboxylase